MEREMTLEEQFALVEKLVLEMKANGIPDPFKEFKDQMDKEVPNDR